MKSPALALGLMVLLGTGCMAQIGRSTPTIAEATPQSPKSPSPLASSPAPVTSSGASTVASRSGAFVNGEHETLGNAKIITENGSQFIEFDQAFKTDSGPDLFVILTRQNQPPITGIQEQDYISLGMLQKTSGSQRYAIPTDLNLSEFASVTIWCREFNANFGYAQLPPQT